MAKNKVHVKKGDSVVVIAGKDKGKRGKVLAVLPSENRVIVEGVNMITKHVKPSAKLQQGGIITQRESMHQCDVLLSQVKNGCSNKLNFWGRYQSEIL